MHRDYAETRNAQSAEEFAQALKDGGYYTDSTSNYAQGIREGLKNIPSETPAKNSSDPNNNEPVVQNQSGDLRDPTLLDRAKDWWNRLQSPSVSQDTESSSSFVRPSAYFANGFANVQCYSII